MRSPLPTSNEVWQQSFVECLNSTVAKFAANTGFLVACSGGVDSLLLLDLMASYFPNRVRCIYVDHQLQQHSVLWGKRVQQHAATLNVPCVLQAVQVAVDGNLEQQARTARYAAFAQHLQANEILLLGHHQQDQAETVLLRLLSGSGVDGLSGMTALSNRANMRLWRPFLSLSREHIEKWAQQRSLHAVQDPMNTAPHYDRVWCRQQLWPVLQQRFPQMQQAIARSSALMQDAKHILDEVCQLDLQACGNAQQLCLLRLSRLSLPRQRQLLSRWMQGSEPYRPALQHVEILQQQVISAKTDAQAVLHWNSLQFRRYQQYLYRIDVKQQLDLNAAEQLALLEKPFAIELKTAFDVASARYQWQQQKQQVGLDVTRLKNLTLRPRSGGEKIHLHGRVGRWPLKKALQAAQILPWFRHTIQILYCDDVILGVLTPVGFWLAQSDYCQWSGWLPNLISSQYPFPLFEQEHDSTEL